MQILLSCWILFSAHKSFVRGNSSEPSNFGQKRTNFGTWVGHGHAPKKLGTAFANLGFALSPGWPDQASFSSSNGTPEVQSPLRITPRVCAASRPSRLLSYASRAGVWMSRDAYYPCRGFYRSSSSRVRALTDTRHTHHALVPSFAWLRREIHSFILARVDNEVVSRPFSSTNRLYCLSSR